ncbi:hypothetical protein K470DRAFT_275376 [Piedraia hortae CBS 480.64]|uniref:Deoxyribonuclease NucA/NucB domain-containing protein n=1 Tax=Piedraia hortae CBS 480.64 TaxID=1314780 RepID=A0A6A7C518_9PEZI|nr:hypothetical protein K470DRAFT_275376 [Piedraia hortae CBS 480.64]
MFKTIFFLFALAILSSAATLKAKPPKAAILNFPCQGNKKSDLHEICKNMCYGINCKGFSAKMFFDKPTNRVKKARRTKSGCSSKNRCSAAKFGKKGYSCDEFPFASTDTSGIAKPINRCVPSVQNSIQGSVLRNFYYSEGLYKDRGLEGKPGWFKLAFAHDSGIKYCGTRPSCTNDGNEYTKDGLSKREVLETRGDVYEHYITTNGTQLWIPGGAEIGDVVYTPKPGAGDDFELHVEHIQGQINGTQHD